MDQDIQEKNVAFALCSALIFHCGTFMVSTEINFVGISIGIPIEINFAF
jgi:hypothetical protein